jgi:fructose-1,6-bisphosphatase II
VRVTEAAALASAHWLGKGDKEAADAAAVEAMRNVLVRASHVLPGGFDRVVVSYIAVTVQGSISFDGVVVIGEGAKDKAPMLFCGERIGDGSPPHVDVAVDPLDGTTACAQGRSGAVAVIALSERGALYDPGPAFYMEKLAVGPAASHVIDIRASVATNLHAIASALRKPIEDTTVVMLDRPRHAQLVKEVRAAGARIRLISDGDVAAAIAVARPGSNVDVLMGVGGTPEGVIAAAALKCLGGSIQGRLWPRHDEDRAAFAAAGLDPTAVLTTDTLCAGQEVLFAATGVSDGELLQGVRFTPQGATTSSLVMRLKSGTIREIHTSHVWKQPASLRPGLSAVQLAGAMPTTHAR